MAVKVSFAKKDLAPDSGFDFGQGYGRVVESYAIVHQFPPNKTTNEQYAPATNVRWLVQRTGPDGVDVAGQEPVEMLMGCGDLAKFHPGVADNADDADPQDQGDAVGTTGNVVVSTDGSQIHPKSKWAHMFASLEDAGFKPDVLEKGYLPDFEGMVALFDVKKTEKQSDRQYKRDPTAPIVKSILKFPYEKGAKGAAGKGTGAKKDSAKAAPAAGTSAKAAATNGSAASAAAGIDADEVASMAVRVLIDLGKKMAGQTLEGGKIAGKLVTVLNTGIKDDDGKLEKIPTAMHKPIREQFGKTEWLAEQATDLGIGYEDGALQFPAAE